MQIVCFLMMWLICEEWRSILIRFLFHFFMHKGKEAILTNFTISCEIEKKILYIRNLKTAFRLSIFLNNMLVAAPSQHYLNHHIKKQPFAGADLDSAFLFAIQIVQSLFFFNPKFQASNLLQ